MNRDTNRMASGLAPRPPGYAEWLTDLKTRIHTAQQRAALAVNRELMLLYWQLGRDILERQSQVGWGAGIIDQISRDLRVAFPDMKGFSRSNLKYMRAFAEAWPDFAIGQQPVGQLPWGHNLVLLTKLKTAGNARPMPSARSTMAGHATCWFCTSSSVAWNAKARR